VLQVMGFESLDPRLAVWADHQLVPIFPVEHLMVTRPLASLDDIGGFAALTGQNPLAARISGVRVM
jgi:hypothetical protein